MTELANTFLEWAGINLLAAQIMAWLTANGALGLLIIACLGVVLVIAGGIVLIHKLDRIPVQIPYARGLVPVALVIAMLVLLIGAGMGVTIWWSDRASDSPPTGHRLPALGQPPGPLKADPFAPTMMGGP